MKRRLLLPLLLLLLEQTERELVVALDIRIVTLREQCLTQPLHRLLRVALQRHLTQLAQPRRALGPAELALARADGKKVVASMGPVAASGGYWIATAADEIWASPTTITGSIGIFAVLPTVDRALARYLGVRLDGAGTTPWAGAVHPGRPLPPEIAEAIQLAIEDGYRDFITKVAESRELDVEFVDEIGQGQVWIGSDALVRGLVDELGGLEDAIEAAAELAGLQADLGFLGVVREGADLGDGLVDVLVGLDAVDAGDQFERHAA